MSTRTILVSLLAATAALSACSFGSRDDGASGAEAAVSGGDDADERAKEEQFYGRKMTCIHARRERTRLNGQKLKRAFHLKSHGCLHGEMYVNPRLEAAKRLGVFDMKTTGKEARFDHRVWMRLTNINQPADDVLDLRGLAIKVLDVPGRKQIEGDPFRGQDFLMNDTRVHFLDDPHQVVRASELTDGARPDLVDGAPNPATDGPIIQALRTRAQGQLSQPHTLLSNPYHSRAPFKYGEEHVIRYFVETCAPPKDGAPIPIEPTPTPDRQLGDVDGTAPRTKDHLTRDLAARASADGGICLLLRAQFRKAAGSASWLDDYLTPWEDEPVTLATVLFPSQTIGDNEDVCERIEFSPLNSIAAHEGVGVMNKGRYYIYKASRAAAALRDRVTDPAYACGEIYPDFERIGPAPQR